MMIDVATWADLPAIMSLEGEAFALVWSETAWREELRSERGYVVVARNPDGHVLGVATFSLVADVVDLRRVIVRQDSRGAGLGRCLLRAGLEWAEVVGADRMLLEVEADNGPALALYRRVAFEPIAVRRSYYGPGRDAIVMRRPVMDTPEEVACA